MTPAGACEMLADAWSYLAHKGFWGDEGDRHMGPSEWMRNNTDAIVVLKECISKVAMEAECTTQK